MIKKITLVLGFSQLLLSNNFSSDISIGGFTADAGKGYVSDSEYRVDYKGDLDWKYTKNILGSVVLYNNYELMPNMKLDYSDLDQNGEGLIHKEITVDNEPFIAADYVVSDLNLKNIDGTLFINSIDSKYLKLDIGGTLRLLSLDVNFDTVSKGLVEKSVTKILPFLYLSGKVPLPQYDFELSSELKYVQSGDIILYDYMIGAKYTFMKTSMVDYSFSAGYRSSVMHIALYEKTLYTDFNGFYGTLNFRF